MWRAGAEQDAAGNSGREKRNLGTLFSEDEDATVTEQNTESPRDTEAVGYP